MPDLNWFAVLAAAVSAFLLGGLWYGPLFRRAWCREAGIDPGALGARHPAQVFGGAFVAALVAAIGLAWFLGPRPALLVAVHAGFAIGVAFVATSFAINYAFANRSLALWLIDAGYHVLQFTLYGVILGAWH